MGEHLVNLPKANILIVDDISTNADLLAKILTKYGYQVELVEDGPTAIQLATSTLPDLILLDILMPEMSGYEVCQSLKADPRTCHIPIIFLTSLENTSDRVKAFSVGGSDFISKPFHVKEVQVRVEHQLRVLNLQRELLWQKEQLVEQNRQLQREIRDRKQVEAALRQSEVNLQQAKVAAEIANRAKSKFLAAMSHELRTPLNAILGFTQLIACENTLPQSVQAHLDIISRSGEHLLRLINSILDMSRIDADDRCFDQETNPETANPFVVQEDLAHASIPGCPLPGSQPDPDVLRASLLSLMPAEWLCQFHKAALLGSDTQILQLIQQIPETHQALANTLADWVNSFYFDILLDLSQPSKQ